VDPVDALTAPDQGERDATPAAEAVYWLRHPEIASATLGTLSALSALLDQWESEPEWEGEPQWTGETEDEDECPE
jgi:hypothetical protein